MKLFNFCFFGKNSPLRSFRWSAFHLTPSELGERSKTVFHVAQCADIDIYCKLPYLLRAWETEIGFTVWYGWIDWLTRDSDFSIPHFGREAPDFFQYFNVFEGREAPPKYILERKPLIADTEIVRRTMHDNII